MKSLKCAGLAIIVIATALSLGCGATNDDDNSTPIGESSLPPTGSQSVSPGHVTIASPLEAKVTKLIDEQTIEAEANGKTITITFPEGTILPESISPEKVMTPSPLEAKVTKLIDEQTIEAEANGKTITITFPEGVDVSKFAENSSQ